MKKYKKNITITFACIFTELMLSVILMLLIMFIFLRPLSFREMIYMVGEFVLLIIAFDLFLYGISLIGRLFIKTTYIIDDEGLIVRKNNNEKIIYFSSVSAITYDFGQLSKYSHHSSALVLLDKEYDELVGIENPPLMMVAHIKRKCSYARMSYYHSKRFLFGLILCIVMAIVLCLIGKLTI